MTLAELSEMIAAVALISGINTAGAIWFLGEATDEQKQAAQALMDAHLAEAK
jgi:hypothetical protein